MISDKFKPGERVRYSYDDKKVYYGTVAELNHPTHYDDYTVESLDKKFNDLHYPPRVWLITDGQKLAEHVVEEYVRSLNEPKTVTESKVIRFENTVFNASEIQFVEIAEGFNTRHVRVFVKGRERCISFEVEDLDEAESFINTWADSHK